MEKSNNKIRKNLNRENCAIVKKLEEMKSSNKDLSKASNIDASKKESGITLIALVVTIVLLLILARSECFNACWRKWTFTTSN